jgi:hypothetical protein
MKFILQKMSCQLPFKINLFPKPLFLKGFVGLRFDAARAFGKSTNDLSLSSPSKITKNGSDCRAHGRGIWWYGRPSPAVSSRGKLLPEPIAENQGNGISAGDIRKFIEAGFNTVESIAYTYDHTSWVGLIYRPKKVIMTIKGISEAKADRVMAEG